ncbi:uncharacterized protein Tco025E_06464 [Trypanosoma conorhini]|uniref:AB hydrolase-1 domain-containing protein n=1 Tax=Trypanosoma conorhini TaxID=83891 RepID=A0A422P3V3_9TRYP|nr:uncharacterized protein Tco025E_06464 [Trypanosoma conorhini]RNF12410.1 hypothetical protein Tco025E_06464 [Trypanosoma conorhini]
MSSVVARASFWLLHAVVHVIHVYIPRLHRVLKAIIGEEACDEAKQQIKLLGDESTTRVLFAIESMVGFRYTAPPYNGHISTVLCSLRPSKPIKYTREVVDGADGNPICLDWLLADEKRGPTNGIMIIFPGLASWSQTNYVQHYVWHAHDKGFHCCVFNTRGMGDTPLTQPRLMSAAWTGDVRWVARTALSRKAISSRLGRSAENVWGVGFSLGGVVLAKYLEEEGKSMPKAMLPFDAALIVNSPLDTLASKANMMKPKNAFYQKNLTGGLVRYAIRHIDIVKQLPGISHDGIRKDPLRFLKKVEELI